MPYDEPVTIEFELTPEDWAETSATHSLESPMIKKAMRTRATRDAEIAAATASRL